MIQTAVRERPIIFTGESVRQIMSGAKTQTRRVIRMDRLKVKLRGAVRFEDGTGRMALKGTYGAEMNPQGAVSIPIGHDPLGVKPGEFDFLCPYIDGRTTLTGRQTWTITPEEPAHLWVREAHEINPNVPSMGHGSGLARHHRAYRADGDSPFLRWRPSIHMPRWASRLTLEITEVRVQRLAEISEEDAKAEGASFEAGGNEELGVGYRIGFRTLWDTLNKPRGYGWESNPFCWAITFKRIGTP